MTSKTRVVVIGTGRTDVRPGRRPHRADGSVIAYDAYDVWSTWSTSNTWGPAAGSAGVPVRVPEEHAREEARPRQEAEPLPSAGGPPLRPLTNDGGS
ncbi:hypothetical protein OK074_2172 [Actinobacteria bacterium OK074]|nr:hypothetical protein OK074_2172 [Actinobacteria bacterium OK074]